MVYGEGMVWLGWCGSGLGRVGSGWTGAVDVRWGGHGVVVGCGVWSGVE